MSDLLAEPPADCDLCPRLAEHRRLNGQSHPDYFNAPVPSFGDPEAHLLIVGLAPGMHGANKTGRPFTGDYAGDLLYGTLSKLGLARGTYDKHPDDGLELVGCMITNAVRCWPPENKPVGAEINQCRPFLQGQIAALPKLKTLLALGKIAHDSTVRTLDGKLKDYPFGHATDYELGGYRLVSSYHCSRYNTQTGRLTEEMFDSVMRLAAQP